MNGRNLTRLAFLLETAGHLVQHLESTTERLFQQPIDVQWLARLESDPDLAERLDAFVARFGRLQDTLADKLVPELMRQMLETPGSAIDNLDRMEKLGLIHSVDEWLEARNLRNRLIHEYMRDPAEFLEALERARELVPRLTGAFRSMKAYALEHWGEGSRFSPPPKSR